MKRISFCLVLMFLATFECSAQTEPGGSLKAGINAPFLDPDLNVSEWVEKFEVESREIFSCREEIVRKMNLVTGERIADVGTGTGIFVEPFSDAVGPRGWVFALDIVTKFVERVERIAELKSLGNVTAMLSGQDDVRLPPDSIDVAFVCDVYHHFEFPVESLRSIKRALRPGGRLYVIDFERIEGVSRPWTMGHVRAGKPEFKSEIEAAGFQFVEEIAVEGFKENYFLSFVRPKS
ncbi:class I SAM-dependent methyltransferase [Rubripirellula tenax]|nr:methyltransferase domain-containing protein [Rubripirellula tenax]